MFLFKQPSEDRIQLFLSSQLDQTFSYHEVGGSRIGAPTGYTLDHNRIKIGEGLEVFTRAVAAVQSWKIFQLGWVKLYWTEKPPKAGATVALLVNHFAFWSLNACRIVYLIEEDGPVQRYGFAYGTLPEHAERGEERFTVEWHHDDDSVWYDIFAFSRPSHLLARIGYPLSRALQKRFAKDSQRAIVEAVQIGA